MSHKNKYFFGLEKDAIDLMKKYDFCVIFVCEHSEDTFIIPKDTILAIIKDLDTIRNQWKINIFDNNDIWHLKVTGKERFDITKFRKNYDYIFSRIIYEKEVFKDEDKETETSNIKIEIEKTELIKSKLIKLSTFSKKSKLFEESISEFFTYFGFVCEHLGGAGLTDVLITEPYRIIIEAKTTSRDSIDKIYFTRLKQHKIKHDADYIVVISNDFSPSVVRDAEIENVVLMKTKILCDILDLDKYYPLSALDLEFIFKKTGLFNDELLNRIKSKIYDITNKINNIPFVVRSLDEEGRNADEIYGRYQMKCEESNIEHLNKEDFLTLLDFMSFPLIDLIKKENNIYYKNLGDDLVIRRLKFYGVLYGNQQ